jgi:hypothetical protein
MEFTSVVLPTPGPPVMTTTRFPRFENVLAAEGVNAPRATGELLVEERVIIKLPADLRDVKVARDLHCREYPLNFRLFHWFALDQGANLVERGRVLAESAVGTFGCFDLLREITGQFNFETAGESDFPCDQLPVASVPAILPGLYEGCIDLHLGSEQMLPSVPSRIPDLVEDSRIDPQLEPPADVAVKSAIRIELTFAQWRMETPNGTHWQERNDVPGEKRLGVAQSVRPKPTTSRTHHRGRAQARQAPSAVRRSRLAT